MSYCVTGIWFGGTSSVLSFAMSHYEQEWMVGDQVFFNECCHFCGGITKQRGSEDKERKKRKQWHPFHPDYPMKNGQGRSKRSQEVGWVVVGLSL